MHRGDTGCQFLMSCRFPFFGRRATIALWHGPSRQAFIKNILWHNVPEGFKNFMLTIWDGFLHPCIVCRLACSSPICSSQSSSELVSGETWGRFLIETHCCTETKSKSKSPLLLMLTSSLSSCHVSESSELMVLLFFCFFSRPKNKLEGAVMQWWSVPVRPGP